MAKVKPSIIEESGAIGDRVYYTRFGKTFSRRRPTQINDQKSEAQLRQRDDSIRALRTQLEAYESLRLPSAQIAAELRSQWPEIADVTLARSDSSVILLLTTQQADSLTADNVERIHNWLSVRLQTPEVEVIVRM